MSDCDLRIGLGDLNARTKNVDDFISDVDGSLVLPRYNPDQIKKSHANSFIPFLKDTRSIILNGRITPQFNNFTFINPRGCSVPDYIFCPLDQIELCKEIKVLTISEIVNHSGIRPPGNLPDHSILMGTFSTSFFQQEKQMRNKVYFQNTTM